MIEPGSLVIQRYQIVRLIGRGGMGAVYEAIDLRLRYTVALKQMIGTTAENAEAFEREATVEDAIAAFLAEGERGADFLRFALDAEFSC